MTSKLPWIRNIVEKFVVCRQALKNCRNPPGHFYSPVVDIDEVLAEEARIWDSSKSIQSIALREDLQISVLQEFEKYYGELPFADEPSDGIRYYLANEYYSYTDGIILYSFLRYLKPKRVIEIGSGFSSALMLDVCERFKLPTHLSFIEPYPRRLNSLLRPADGEKTDILVKRLQEVPLDFFRRLQKGDILFVDSTHVSKTGSDVNYILFEILPELSPGVTIHIHDIFDSFEYPKAWVYQKRSWNEIYLLRAFLMNNNSYQVLCFPHYLHTHRPDAFANMPLCYKNQGSSLWLQKV